MIKIEHLEKVALSHKRDKRKFCFSIKWRVPAEYLDLKRYPEYLRAVNDAGLMMRGRYRQVIVKMSIPARPEQTEVDLRDGISTFDTSPMAGLLPDRRVESPTDVPFRSLENYQVFASELESALRGIAVHSPEPEECGWVSPMQGLLSDDVMKRVDALVDTIGRENPTIPASEFPYLIPAVVGLACKQKKNK